MACLAISLGRARGAIDEAKEAALLAELVLTPGLLAEALRLEPARYDLNPKTVRKWRQRTTTADAPMGGRRLRRARC